MHNIVVHISFTTVCLLNISLDMDSKSISRSVSEIFDKS